MNFLGGCAMVILAAFVPSISNHCFILPATFMNDFLVLTIVSLLKMSVVFSYSSVFRLFLLVCSSTFTCLYTAFFFLHMLIMVFKFCYVSESKLCFLVRFLFHVMVVWSAGMAVSYSMSWLFEEMFSKKIVFCTL